MTALSAFVGQHFAFASGRTGVLQKRLLSASDRDRLLGTSSLQEVEKVLTELSLTDNIHQGLKHAETILPAVFQWIQQEIEEMTPTSKRSVFTILWIEEDAALISYLLKKHAGLTSAISKEPPVSIQVFNTTELTALIEHDEEGSLPKHLVSAIRSIKEVEHATPQSIDTAVAQCIAEMQLQLARSSGSKLIQKFVQHRIDLLNIRTAIRLLQEPEVDTNEHLIMGGTIDPSVLRSDLASITKAIARSTLSYELSDAVKKAAEDPNALEQALAKVTARDIANMWNVPMTIEPIFAFAALAQSHLKLLRVLVIGKRAGLSPQELKHILPPFISASHYVL